VIDLIVDGKSLIEELVTSGKALRDVVILAPPSLAPEEAYLTHSNTLNDFYVTDNSLTSRLEELCEDIKNAHTLSKVSNLRVSDLVVACFPDDQVCYKASVLALEPTISVTDVRTIPKKWKTVPPFAIHCSLGIRNETEEAFDKFLELFRVLPSEIASVIPEAIHCSLGLSINNEEADEKFIELANKEETYFKMTVIKEDDPNLIKLSLNGQSVAELLTDQIAGPEEDLQCADVQAEENCVTVNTNTVAQKSDEECQDL
jgi:hypothetical protein